VKVHLTGTDVYGLTVNTDFITINNLRLATLGIISSRIVSGHLHGYRSHSARRLVTHIALSANGNDLLPGDSNDPGGTTVTLGATISLTRPSTLAMSRCSAAWATACGRT